MFSEKLSNVLDRLALWSGVQRARRLRGLNPNNFSVENIRVLMDTSTRTARDLCERGVRAGYFDKHVAVLHPVTYQAVATAEREEELPREVVLETGFHNEDDEPETVPVSSLKKRTYYSLHQE